MSATERKEAERERLRLLVMGIVFDNTGDDQLATAVADEVASSLAALASPVEPVAWTTPYDLESIAPGDGYIGTLYGRPTTELGENPPPDPRMVALYASPVPTPAPEMREFEELVNRYVDLSYHVTELGRDGSRSIYLAAKAAEAAARTALLDAYRRGGAVGGDEVWCATPALQGERERRYFPGGDPERAGCCPNCRVELSPASIQLLAASLPASEPDGDMLNECDIRPIATGGVQLHAPGCRSWNEAQDERALRWLEIVEADSRADAIARFRAMSYRERDLLRRCAASMEVVNGVPLSRTRAAPSSDGPALKEGR